MKRNNVSTLVQSGKAQWINRRKRKEKWQREGERRRIRELSKTEIYLKQEYRFRQGCDHPAVGNHSRLPRSWRCISRWSEGQPRWSFHEQPKIRFRFQRSVTRRILGELAHWKVRSHSYNDRHQYCQRVFPWRAVRLPGGLGEQQRQRRRRGRKRQAVTKRKKSNRRLSCQLTCY